MTQAGAAAQGPAGEPADTGRRLEVVGVLAYDGRSPVRRVLYPLYVVLLVSGVYGVALAQGVAAVLVERPALREALTGWAVPAGVVLGAAAVAGAYALGRVRGPVVPDLGLVDLVLPADLGRARLLRPWWRASALTVVALGAIAGLVAGAGAAIRGLVAPVVPLLTVAAGAALGLVLAHLWLRGQVLRAEGAPRRGEVARTEQALALLPARALRAQAVLDRTLTTAVYAGDPAHVRREVYLGRPRARRRRLPALGRWGTVLAADLLVLRRSPVSAVIGLLLVGAGVPVSVWALTPGGVPLALPAGLVVLNAGAGLLVRGLRSHADTMGSPMLLGTSGPGGALAHTLVALVPVAAAEAVCLPALGLGGWTGAAGLAGGVLTVLAAQLVGAYRGALPAVPTASSGGNMIVAWLLLPHLMPLGIGLVSVAGHLGRAGRPGLLSRFDPAVVLLVLSLVAAAGAVELVRSRTAPER